MHCTIALVIKPVYPFSDVTLFDCGQYMSVILILVFHFRLNQIILRRVLSLSYYRQSCYLWHHRGPFIFVTMTIDRLRVRSSSHFASRNFRYVNLPISSQFVLYFGKRICGLKLCNALQFVHYVASHCFYCASFVRLRYSLLIYLGVDPLFFRLPATMSLMSSCLYQAWNEFTLNYLVCNENC
jgi:hypothetical protein